MIGASGDIGREIVTQILSHRILSPSERLQLVGRKGGDSERLLFGHLSDFADAYAETVPEMDVALSPEDVVGDIIVMVAGLTNSTDIRRPASRDELAEVNRPVLETYAQAIKKNGHGHEVIIAVTNPVELCVEVFARQLGRERVIGVGAYSDSLRFRREIAWDLGIRRQRVHAFMAGEHGFGAVPLWSTLQIYGMDPDEIKETRGRLRRGGKTENFPSQVQESKRCLERHVIAGNLEEAYRSVGEMTADLRVIFRPWVTHFSGAKTAVATANVVVDFLKTLRDGREILVAGNVRLEGEFSGLRSVVGVPMIVGNQGISRIVEIAMEPDEERLLKESARAVERKLSQWMK